MVYKLARLSNNLRLLTIPMPSLESATVTVWVRTGSRNEEDKLLGISHFLEHMAFKGGKKYKNAREVSEAIDSVGGEFNAGTSKEWTQFYIRIRSRLLERAFDVLSDMILTPGLEQKEIDKEKGVIIEEINLYEDTPVRRVWDIFEQVIFEKHPLGRDIIGTKETVSSLQKNDFVNYRDEHYFAQNMLITVAGGVDESGVLKLTERYFGKLPGKDRNSLATSTYEDKIRVKLVSKKNEQAHFIVGFPADKMGARQRFADAVMNVILGGGMSSRLFSEVREKRGLAYSVRSDVERFLEAGYFSVYAGVDPGKMEEALKVILDQVYGLAGQKYKIGTKELEKAKEYIKGHLALSLEDTRGVNSFFGHEQLMLKRTRTPDEVYRKVNEVTVEDLYRRAKKIFVPAKANLAIIGPYKSEEKFANILEKD